MSGTARGSGAGVPAGAGMWLYPWDLLDLGAERVADTLAGMGLAEAYVAASYHTVHVLSRANPARRFVHAPRPALYFRHDEGLWAGLALQPYRSPLVDDLGDALERARAPFARAGIDLVAWTVCLHGPPQVAAATATQVLSPLGGRVGTSPCVRNPEVRAFARALVRDAGSRADRVQLEAAHWIPGPHHQHAKFDSGEPALAELLTAWCVCAHCLDALAAAGGDPERTAADLRAAAARALEERSPAGAMDRAGALDWLAARVGDLDRFLAARRGAVTALAASLAEASGVPVEFVPSGDAELTGADPAALDAAGVAVRHLAYGAPERVADRVASLDPEAARRSGIGLSLLAADTADEAALRRSIALAAGGGLASVGFYNFGLVGEQRHRWVRSALAGTASWGRGDAVTPGAAATEKPA